MRKSLITHERLIGVRHIVVADDDEITDYAYAGYLKHSGYHVLVAYQTKDALLIAEKIEIDVLVTDYRLDSMDGVELVKAMRQLQPGIPSIIVSGYTEDFGVESEEIRCFASRPVFSYLSKRLRTS